MASEADIVERWKAARCYADAGHWPLIDATIAELERLRLPAPSADGLREALRKARDQFIFYAEEHLKKTAACLNRSGDKVSALESAKKADANLRLAEMCDCALAAADAGGPVLQGTPEPEIVHAIARALYWRDHQPFPWEEVGEVAVIEDYTDMGRIALAALKRTLRPSPPSTAGKS